MRKNQLLLLLFLSLFALGISLLISGLYFRVNVEKLVGHYPIYNQKTGTYDLVMDKPRHWVRLSQITPLAYWAIVLSEDWAFYDHEGVDFNQLSIVLSESYQQKRLVRGASTITQQVIKNVILTNERSLWRKFREMILAFKAERILTKNRILEIYLNIVELGDGIYGIKQAAKTYFNKDPSQLSAREGAFLAMLLPSPVKYSESFHKRKLTSFAREQIERILLKLKQANIFTEEDRQAALLERFWWEPLPAEEIEQEVEMDVGEDSLHLDGADSSYFDFN